ncbi:hypothetical protein EDD18DRAFT_1112060 [Armillaria luteobubalina]|uniref:Uncharacterized protein n=1 Tax=Armillaria luteobubalina TaxID=153913 RepID=A0AA39PH37_9AGAR|nr:hypothetical protein EDD18DRAFT_1112060 [Armillaria luteobubalina]
MLKFYVMKTQVLITLNTGDAGNETRMTYQGYTSLSSNLGGRQLPVDITTTYQVHWPHPLDTPFIYEERRTNFRHLDSNLGAISNGNKQIKSRDTHPHSQDDDPSSQRDFGGYQNWYIHWGPSPSSFEISTTRHKRSGDTSLRYGTMRGYEVEVQEMMKEIGELRDKR